ncbi:MAG: hypothetical protein EOO61_03765 [Hymenobacter sp.]|nr:MAG: hypothetical protein EOO61_03765 [Hymenobacter sp.]
MAVSAGTSNLYFSRDTKVYLAQGSNIWEIPVLNGYAFGQSTNTSEVTLSEMSDSVGTSRRGRKVFTDSVAPAEWSFTTYVRPTLASAKVRAVEEALWANFVAANSYTAATPAWASGVTIGASALDFNFSASNKTTLGEFDLYFVLGAANVTGRNYANDGDTTIYRIPKCSINEVSITFDIDGIASLAWSGMGNRRTEVASFDASTAINIGVNTTDNFIRNRLTQLQIVSSVSGSSKTYNVTLTGGTITLTNNISYLTPETLGVVNAPLGHVTGTRTIGGSFTAYLDEQTNGTIDLTEDLGNATGIVTNSFALDFYVGGKAAGDAPRSPGMQFKIPNAHLTIPAINVEDVVGVSIDFSALPSTISGTDEVSKISYVAT